MFNTNYNALFMQFFQCLAIFQYNLTILPKISLNPQWPECKQCSFCSIFHKLSENHSLENSPCGGTEVIGGSRTINRNRRLRNLQTTTTGVPMLDLGLLYITAYLAYN
jgi:hypothetical protein